MKTSFINSLTVEEVEEFRKQTALDFPANDGKIKVVLKPKRFKRKGKKNE